MAEHHPQSNAFPASLEVDGAVRVAGELSLLGTDKLTLVPTDSSLEGAANRMRLTTGAHIKLHCDQLLGDSGAPVAFQVVVGIIFVATLITLAVYFACTYDQIYLHIHVYASNVYLRRIHCFSGLGLKAFSIVILIENNLTPPSTQILNHPKVIMYIM